MNVLFLSPFFPSNAPSYCRALARRGVQVLGIGDQPPECQPSSLNGVLAEYVFEPRMADYSAYTRLQSGSFRSMGHFTDSTRTASTGWSMKAACAMTSMCLA